MAYFRVTQKQSGGGGGATITVSYESSFYGKTITCSDGVTTYTKTTTSSGTTTFDVEDEGTWTITCDGVVKTVNVVLNYTTALSISKTITVYSAANDTLSFTDASGSKTVTTDSSGQGSVTVVYNDGDFITFTSTVANDPDDLSSYYSRTIQLHTNTTEVYVMPDNTLYWWGYINSNCESVTSANGWTSRSTLLDPVYNAQNVALHHDAANGKGAGIGNKTPISSANKVVGVIQGVTLSNGRYGYIAATNPLTTKTFSDTSNPFTQTVDVLTNTKAQYAMATSNYSNFYCALYTESTRSMTAYAFWYDAHSSLSNFFSAANDTVYYTENGVDIVVAVTNGAGEAVVDFSKIPLGVTLKSSIADDPDSLSTTPVKFSKVFNGANADNEFYLMPQDGAKMYYWYGWISDDLEDGTAANGWSRDSTFTFNAPIHHTRDIQTNTQGTNKYYSGVGLKSAISGAMDFHLVAYGVSETSGQYGYLFETSSKVIQGWGNVGVTNITTAGLSKIDYTKTSSATYISAFAANVREFQVIALWHD